MNEGCGVVAVASRNRAAESIYLALMALQHRGQEAAGIAVFDGEIKNYRVLGLIGEAFKDFDIEKIDGQVGIGHVYYSIKISTPENAQPTLLHTSAGDIAIAHNGIITNAENLKEELM
ncbi:MAG: amidophosphoribosyltransferase, partial [Thermoplasmata archaeon]